MKVQIFKVVLLFAFGAIVGSTENPGTALLLVFLFLCLIALYIAGQMNSWKKRWLFEKHDIK
jgi:hypothetical protein